MTQQEIHKQLGEALWAVANDLRGAMNADDFRDYMLSLLFLKYLSDNYEKSAQSELQNEYPTADLIEDMDGIDTAITQNPLQIWYANNPAHTSEFEKVMRSRVYYAIQPDYLWSHITELARTNDTTLLTTLKACFTYVEETAFSTSFNGLFSEINLDSDKLGKDYTARNKKIGAVIKTIAKKLREFSTATDTLGDAYEYLIGKFAAGGGSKAGEFYTPQKISTILSKIVITDCQDTTKNKTKIDSVFDFACGSGSLLLNVRRQATQNNIEIGTIYGQEKNITTYNLARMNMMLHGVNNTQCNIFHGDTLTNDWEMLSNANPSTQTKFDAIVANPPFSYRWDPKDDTAQDMRFRNHGVAPKSSADFAFLLHGLHYLKDDGTMAIILPHGVLFRGGAEAKMRQELLNDHSKHGKIDTVIGLPSKLFYSTGIPVCILVLKKCKAHDDILFINAEKQYTNAKKQNLLENEHIEKIVEAYKNRSETDRFSRRVPMKEIEENAYNLNIARYVDTTEQEKPIDIAEVMQHSIAIDDTLQQAIKKHNELLTELQQHNDTIKGLNLHIK